MPAGSIKQNGRRRITRKSINNNMDYELAKQLKDAGFPQNGNGEHKDLGYFIADRNYQAGEDIPVNTPYYVPTLSELIEACKGTIIKLWILKDGQAGVQLEGESLDDVIYYSSPEEAVAKLWLALNAKSPTLQ
jgi:hypothetical protein